MRHHLAQEAELIAKRGDELQRDHERWAGGGGARRVVQVELPRVSRGDEVRWEALGVLAVLGRHHALERWRRVLLDVRHRVLREYRR